jgi:hypothetical protein
MLPDALPGSCSKGVAGCRHGGKSELTGLGITRGAALGNRTPDLRITSVVQRTMWPMVGVFERWAIPSSPSLVTAMMDGRGHNGAQEVGPQMSTTLMWSASGLSKVRKPALDPVSSQGGSAAGRDGGTGNRGLPCSERWSGVHWVWRRGRRMGR